MKSMSTFLNRSAIQFVFIDWFGVLSTNYYWCIQSQRNPILKEWCDFVFSDTEILKNWMRGKLDLEHLSQLKIKISHTELVSDFLKDLKHYEPDRNLIEALNLLFPDAKKILVTDNFVLFKHILKEYKQIESYFYKVYLSYEIGLLKNDSPKSLFDHILDDLKLKDFSNCVLIDDQSQNCEQFSKRNGRTILVN